MAERLAKAELEKKIETVVKSAGVPPNLFSSPQAQAFTVPVLDFEIWTNGWT